MNRRIFLQSVASWIAISASSPTVLSAKKTRRKIAITLDDPHAHEQPLLSWQERADGLLTTLKNHGLRTCLFVCGTRVDNEDGKSLIKKWDDANHFICNHSYSHLNFNSPDITYDRYSTDFIRGENVITSYKNFHKRYRFPFLKEGNTEAKRDAMRQLLSSRGYSSGQVTVDTSDWYIDQRLRDRLKLDPSSDTKPYRDYYLAHILDRAEYYDGLSVAVLGRSIRHTVLLHHTLLNALYLDSLIMEFKRRGWDVVSADEAYSDPVFERQPNVIPAGESLLWSLAKETGRYDNKLRYPGENDTYEKDRMDKAGL